MREPAPSPEAVAQAEHEQMLRALTAMKVELAQTIDRADRVLVRLRAKVLDTGHAVVLRLLGAP